VDQASRLPYRNVAQGLRMSTADRALDHVLIVCGGEQAPDLLCGLFFLQLRDAGTEEPD
jgi:hypothetical protein